MGMNTTKLSSRTLSELETGRRKILIAWLNSPVEESWVDIRASKMRNADHPDMVGRVQRANQVKKWMQEYEIECVDYPSVNALLLKVGGLDFVDKTKDFPSEKLFANIALAINTWNVPKRDFLTNTATPSRFNSPGYGRVSTP